MGGEGHMNYHAASDNKSFWRYVKSKSKTKEGISDLMNENDSLSNSDKDI